MYISYKVNLLGPQVASHELATLSEPQEHLARERALESTDGEIVLDLSRLSCGFQKRCGWRWNDTETFG